jgi:hypothetical protein
MALETQLDVLGVVLVIWGLWGIYDAIRFVKRHKRAAQPMFWTWLILLGGTSALLLVLGLLHFFAA